MPKHHNLRLFYQYYNPILERMKLSDIRLNDRDYHVGDTINYHSGYPTLTGYYYDGRIMRVVVTHIDSGFGLLEGYVNLSIKLIDGSEVVK
jgi:hypothetical protein